jgi:hypothetical protein
MYGTNVSKIFLEHAIGVLAPCECLRGHLPTTTLYPGLLTDVGMVVASLAFDPNTTNIQLLNRAAYHGTVVWYVVYVVYCFNTS